MVSANILGLSKEKKINYNRATEVIEKLLQLKNELIKSLKTRENIS